MLLLLHKEQNSEMATIRGAFRLARLIPHRDMIELAMNSAKSFISPRELAASRAVI